jgi:methylase of polypeptide subunit release factors
MSSDNGTDKLKALKEWFQSDTVQYTSTNIGSLLNSPKPIRAPIQIIPASAGTVRKEQFPFITTTNKQFTACQCLLSLFMIGLCVNIDDAIDACTAPAIQLLKELGLICHCEYDKNLIYAIVSITPIDLHETRNTLHVVTDWHPRVLNMINIHKQKVAVDGLKSGEEEEVVMYIGPDSLSLIEHWIVHYTTKFPTSRNETTVMLDLCTGSGVQALVYLMMSMNIQPNRTHHAVCVDVNPRALRFCAFSAALNGIPSNAITLVQGDIVNGVGKLYKNDRKQTRSRHGEELHNSLIQVLQAIHPSYHLITANPPFLPVPPNEKSAPYLRHGLYSSGGPSGERVLAAVLSLAKFLSYPNGGYTAIVSEFFFRGNDFTVDTIHELVGRLQSYWLGSQYQNCTVVPGSRLDSSKAIVFVNEFPISRQEYANRRADSFGEAQSWYNHLKTEDILSCSPGLIFIQNLHNPESKRWQWNYHVVPKSNMGSIWTPSNTNAIGVTRARSREIFGW